MVQAIINFGEHEDLILNVIKGKFGFRNKSDAVNFVISEFEENLLEPELRPEYVEKIKNLEKFGRFKSYKSISALRKEIEHA